MRVPRDSFPLERVLRRRPSLELSVLWRDLVSDLSVFSQLRRYSLSEVVDAELAATGLPHDAYDKQKAAILRRAQQGGYARDIHSENFVAQLSAHSAAEREEARPLFVPIVRTGHGLFAITNIALANWVLDDPITFERAAALDMFASTFTLQNVFTTRDVKLSQSLRNFFRRRTNCLSSDQLGVLMRILQSRADGMYLSLYQNVPIRFIPKIEGMVLEAYAEAFLGMAGFPRSEECTLLLKKVWQIKSLRNNIPFARFNPIIYAKMLWVRRRLVSIIDDAQELLNRTGGPAAKEAADIYAANGYSPGNLMNTLIPLYETVSRAIVFALLELARTPLVQEELRHEIAVNIHRELEYCSSTDSLLSRVWQETLRLWPPVSNETRKITTENNLLFPKDSKVVVVWSVFHRNPRVWGADVNKFNPERWQSVTRDQRQNFHPFGLGAQRCVAMDYASFGGRTILKRIVESGELQSTGTQLGPITADRGYMRGPDPRFTLLRFAPLKQEN